MSSVTEKLINKPEVQEILKNKAKLEKNQSIEWNDYSGDLSGSEAMFALFELGAKFSILISKLYTMSIQDWEELQNIYDTYCKLDSNKDSSDEDISLLQRAREFKGKTYLTRD